MVHPSKIPDTDAGDHRLVTLSLANHETETVSAEVLRNSPFFAFLLECSEEGASSPLTLKLTRLQAKAVRWVIDRFLRRSDWKELPQGTSCFCYSLPQMVIAVETPWEGFEDNICGQHATWIREVLDYFHVDYPSVVEDYNFYTIETCSLPFSVVLPDGTELIFRCIAGFYHCLMERGTVEWVTKRIIIPEHLDTDSVLWVLIYDGPASFRDQWRSKRQREGLDWDSGDGDALLAVVDHLGLRWCFAHLSAGLKLWSEPRYMYVVREALQAKGFLDDNGHIVGLPKTKREHHRWTKWVYYFLCEDWFGGGETMDRKNFFKLLGKCRWRGKVTESH